MFIFSDPNDSYFSYFKHNSKCLWGLCLKQDMWKAEIFMHVSDRKLADIAGWKSHKNLDVDSALTAIVISLPLLSCTFSVSHSHILSLAPLRSSSRSLLRAHTFLSMFFLSGSLKVIISLRPVWRASRHMTRHQSLLIPSPSQVI